MTTGATGKEFAIQNYADLTINVPLVDQTMATALTITGTGMTTLGTANTLSGQTALLGGTLKLTNQLALQNSIRANTAGTTLTVTTTAGLGALTLSNTATLAFGGGSTTFTFGTFTPNGNVLNITGYSNATAQTAGSSGASSDDRLILLGNQSSNLADFNFGSGAGNGVSEIALGGNFFEVTSVTAVPEPSTYVGCLLVLAGMGWSHGRRRVVSWRSTCAEQPTQSYTVYIAVVMSFQDIDVSSFSCGSCRLIIPDTTIQV